MLTLPSMAAAAYAHGKVGSDGHSLEQVFEEARAFAQSDYVVALQQGPNSLLRIAIDWRSAWQS